MNVVIIGIDKSLVGGTQLGDAVERHGKYGEFVDHLDIIVYTHFAEELSLFKISDNVIGYPTNSKSKLHFFIDALKIFKQINAQHKVDVVVCQDPFVMAWLGCYLKKKYKIKLQVNFHGDFWQNPSWRAERWLNIFFLLISKFTVPCADAVRVMSAGQQKKLIQAGIHKEKIKIIATPVDLTKYFTLSADLPMKDQAEKIILHIGRDDKVKDYETLIKAFNLVQQKYPSAQLYQIGADKKIKQALQQYPIKNSNKIVLKGRRSHEETIKLLCQADIFVLSSTSESFGKVLVEANACGKPVVATATTGAQEIIQDGYNGFLVPIKDSTALAQQIIKLLNNSKLAQQIGEHGRQLVQKKYGDNTHKIIELWQALIK